MSILAERFEPSVLDRISQWLIDPVFAEAMDQHLNAHQADVAPLWDQLAEVEQRLQVAAERWATGDLLDLEHATIRRTLTARHAELTAEISHHRVPESVHAADLQHAWRAGTVEDRRSVIAVLARPIRLLPPYRDGRRLPPEARIDLRPAWD